MDYKTLNTITIESSALRQNYNYFKELSPYQATSLVLKANAYGHGLVPIARFIDDNFQIPFICVDSLYEAYELYKNKIRTPIFIMGYTNPENFKIWKKLPFIFSVSDPDTLSMLNKYQPGCKIHLKLDTGMHRLGLQAKDLPDFMKILESCKNIVVDGIYSHLSCADLPNKLSFTTSQIRTFKQLTQRFTDHGYQFTWKHLSATAGAEILHDQFFNLARVGLGFYGYSPFGPHTSEGIKQRKELKPALTLTSTIAVKKSLVPGDSVSYGASYKAKQLENIAILPIGYNEGLSRDLSSRGVVLAPDGTSCPIIGKICMNMTIIKIPRTINLKTGDLVTVISPIPQSPSSIYQISRALNTIPYTVLTGLHPSIRRIII